MSEEQYKLCPSCGNRNGAGAVECAVCQADLTGVRPRKKEQDPGAAPVSPRAETAGVVGKICSECGTVNPPGARKCGKCGEDLSDAVPGEVPAGGTGEVPAGEPGEEKTPEKGFALETPEGRTLLVLSGSGEETVIGREAALAEYLKDRLYVSRRQAAVRPRGGGLYIRNLSATNPTFVNCEALEADAERLLAAGDEIGLGGKIVDGGRQPLAAYLILRETE